MHAEFEVALAAVQQNGHDLEHLSNELKADRNLVLWAVERNPKALEHAGLYKSDRVVVLAAIWQNANSLQYAYNEMKADLDIVLAVLSSRKAVH